MKETFTVNGMTCKHCAARVEDGIKTLNGIQKVKVNLKKNQATVKFDESVLDLETIKNKVKETGYEVEV